METTAANSRAQIWVWQRDASPPNLKTSCGPRRLNLFCLLRAMAHASNWILLDSLHPIVSHGVISASAAKGAPSSVVGW